MNDRIKQLLEQVGGYGAQALMHPDDVEKFAELIVKECARTAAYFSIENKRIHPDIDPRNMPEANRMVYHSTCQGVAEEIREQFGVE